MQNFAKTTTKLKAMKQDEPSENGLQKLVTYYQKLFDRKENRDHYSPEDYQNAKRRFVKYLLKNRGRLEG
jgi:sugar phosphate permease